MSFACLMYHSLSDGRFPDLNHSKYSLTRGRFSEHMKLLRGEGFETRSFADLLGAAASGVALPKRCCVLSFDDGHRSSLDIAEILAETGMRGTFFLTRDFCEKRDDFLRRDEIRRLAEEGHDFGTHGLTHHPLTAMPVERMRTELDYSKRWLEDLIGRTVESMSLPGGYGGPAVIEAAFASGYRLVGISEERMIRRVEAPAVISRFPVHFSYDAAGVRGICLGNPLYIYPRSARSMAVNLLKRLLPHAESYLPPIFKE